LVHFSGFGIKYQDKSGNPGCHLYICRFDFLGPKQGDQIGRFFAHLGLIFFEQFFENFLLKSYVFNLPKNELGYTMGDFSRTHLVTLFRNPKIIYLCI
jgi:hypothetical protein